jgi:acyl-CoA dehydrogenase
VDALLTRRLELPMFDDAHRALARDVEAWCAAVVSPGEHANTDVATRTWVKKLGTAGWLRYAVPAQWGGALAHVDSRSLCIVREVLASHSGLADFAFAMQGLGSGAITLAGSDECRSEWLPRVASGAAIMAFALSEPQAGSDVGAMTTSARRDGDKWVLNGEKTWISNGGIADAYCVFARTDAASTGARGISAFLVPATTPGLSIARRIEVIAPHPLATLAFDQCAVPANTLLGSEGEGFKLAMRTLDIFRTSVAAAALGFARRALVETVAHLRNRAMFGSTLGDQPLAQAMLGDMHADFDAAALLTARAAWLRDTGATSTRAEAAMAKLVATESASRIIDHAVQLHGARGIESGAVVEQLYRDIRALRIYEGASEVQRLIIGREAVGTDVIVSGALTA